MNIGRHVMPCRFSKASRITSALVLFLLSIAFALHAAPPSKPDLSASVERFPPGTVLVAHHGSRTYFATGFYFYVREPGVPVRSVKSNAQFFAPYSQRERAFLVPVHYLKGEPNAPQAVSFSSDAKRVILHYVDGALVLRASDLKVLRYMPYCYAWWEGSTLAYLSDDLVTGGRRRGTTLGKDTSLMLASANGRYLLSSRQIRSGTSSNNYVPIHRMQLWKTTGNGRVRLVRNLTNLPFDPGSSYGGPCRLAVFSPKAVAFGGEDPGAVFNNTLCVLSGRRVVNPLTDGHGRALWFGMTDPVATSNSLVGLATARMPGSWAMQMAEPKYLYRITESGVKVVPMPRGTTLVTYDAARGGLGIGTADSGGVVVRYGGFKLF